MKSLFVNQLTSGDTLQGEPFLLIDVTRRETKDGRPFLLGTVGDREGQLGGVFWNVPPDIAELVQAGQVYAVTGQVNQYKDNLQITITDLQLVSQPDMSLFIRASQRPPAEMIAELQERIAGLSEPWRKLTSHILLDSDFLPQFTAAPAARQMHHAYMGGLLEHTLSMAQLAAQIADHYPYVNKDLLIAGTLLHDLGKTAEYNLHDGFSFSDDGRLVGHIVRAVVIVERAIAELGDIPPEAARELIHLIAAHHGKLEWGSPVVPKTVEAVILHQIDMLDSRVQGFFDHLRRDGAQGEWSVKASLMMGAELKRPSGFA
jgi:3'-5' exoribonuclease